MLKIALQIGLGFDEDKDKDGERKSCLRIFGFENLQIYHSLVSHVLNT